MNGGANPETTSVAEAVLGSLLEESHQLRPDELPGAVRRHAARLGLMDATLYLADVRQLALTPFPANESEALAIDTTEAGRCYRESTMVISDDDRVAWFPLLDGTDRVGVMGARCGGTDSGQLTRGMHLAALVAELVLAKSGYGDHIVTTRRLKDLSLAAEIRWSMIPPLTFTSPDFSIAGFLEPAYDIAGDTFDYAVNGNTAHVAIFDAVGHGLEASRIANLALTAYRHSRRQGLAMRPTYAAIDTLVEATFERSAFATAQLAVIDLPDGRMQWINAGHPAPLLLRRGQAVQALPSTPALPIGISEGVPELHQLDLEPGDTIAFYSDGVTEARSPDGEEFGVKRLADQLSHALDAGTNPPEIVRWLLHDVVDYQQGDVEDDATLLLVTWRPQHRQQNNAHATHTATS